MARVLFVWELGGGLGHITPYLGLAEALRARGHGVAFAVRELNRAHLLLGARGFRYYQAPIRVQMVSGFPRALRTYGEILLSAGCADPIGLTGLVEGWRRLYEMMRPDVVLFDHSPIALLASRSFSFKKVVVGYGFILPPDLQPMPNLRPWQKDDPLLPARVEGRLLDALNGELARLQLPPLSRVGELLNGDARALLTFPELDPYQQWRQEPYLPLSPINLGGESPQWPEGQGARVFAYLQPFRGLENLLAALAQRQLPTLFYGEGVAPELRAKYAGPTLRFLDRYQDLEQVSRQCDFAILNGNYNTSTRFLLAGKPLLLTPIHLEHLLTTLRVVKLGAALHASGEKEPDAAGKLGEMLAQLEGLREGAQAFAHRHAALDQHRQIAQLVALVERTLGPAPPPTAGAPVPS